MAYMVVVPHQYFRVGDIITPDDIDRLDYRLDGIVLTPCHGQWVSIREYPELYDSLINSHQKEIDGVLHRMVPDLRESPE